MTSMRFAAYVGRARPPGSVARCRGQCSGSGSPPPREPRPLPQQAHRQIASEVQAQALLLRERLAQAPAPDLHHGNPLPVLLSRQSRGDAPARQGVVLDPPAPCCRGSSAVVDGIAEETTPDGPRRTAVIGGAADALWMSVTAGESFADRTGHHDRRRRDRAEGFGHRRLPAACAALSWLAIRPPALQPHDDRFADRFQLRTSATADSRLSASSTPSTLTAPR